MFEYAYLPNGGRIAYDVFDFTDPWSAAPPLLLVHGLSKNRRFWWRFVPAFAQLFRVITLDQRGHGDSSVPPPDELITIASFARDLDAFMDAIGLDAADLVAAEFSSTIAIEFAVRYPRRVRSLSLYGFLYNSRKAPIDWAEWSRLAREKGALAWAIATNKFRVRQDSDPRLRAWHIRQQARTPGWLLAKVFDAFAGVDLSDDLARVRVPSLVIAGSESQQSPIETVTAGVAKMPNAELEVIDGAPFNVMTNEPARCIDATLAFLGRIGRRLE